MFIINRTNKVRRQERTLSRRQCHPVALPVSAVDLCSFPCSLGAPKPGSAHESLLRTNVQHKSNEQGTTPGKNTVETTVPPGGTAVSAVDLLPFPCGLGAPKPGSAHESLLRTNVHHKSNEQGTTPGKNTVETAVPPGGTAVSAVNLLPFPCSVGAPKSGSAHESLLRTNVHHKSNEQGTMPGKNTVETTVPRGTAVSAEGNLLPFPCSLGTPKPGSAHESLLRTNVHHKSNEQGTTPGKNTVETTVPPRSPRGNETLGYGANRLRRIDADEPAALGSPPYVDESSELAGPNVDEADRRGSLRNE